jgi:hypothetical protein
MNIKTDLPTRPVSSWLYRNPSQPRHLPSTQRTTLRHLGHHQVRSRKAAASEASSHLARTAASARTAGSPAANSLTMDRLRPLRSGSRLPGQSFVYLFSLVSQPSLTGPKMLTADPPTSRPSFVPVSFPGQESSAPLSPRSKEAPTILLLSRF